MCRTLACLVVLAVALVALAACGVDDRNNNMPGTVDLAMPLPDLKQGPIPDLKGWDGGFDCVEGQKGCYTVYAHGDHFLYKIDLANKDLVPVGPFNAPMVTTQSGQMVEDTITDLAVSPNDVLYAISNTNLYTASPTNGQVTKIGSVKSCGVVAVALSFAPDGQLYAGDYLGAFCKIDITKNPPVVTQIGTLSGGLALAGDIVVVGDGTMYGTAVRKSDGSNGPTVTNNLLVKIDPQTGTSTIIGSTGFPRLYGAAFALGQVFAFTHNGSGQVVTIDPKTGKGTQYNIFKDPKTTMNITFAGAAVNPNVDPIIQ